MSLGDHTYLNYEPVFLRHVHMTATTCQRLYQAAPGLTPRLCHHVSVQLSGGSFSHAGVCIRHHHEMSNKQAHKTHLHKVTDESFQSNSRCRNREPVELLQKLLVNVVKWPVRDHAQAFWYPQLLSLGQFYFLTNHVCQRLLRLATIVNGLAGWR